MIAGSSTYGARTVALVDISAITARKGHTWSRGIVSRQVWANTRSSRS